MCAAQPGPAAGPLADRAWVMFAVTLFILVVVVVVVVVAILIACWWSGAAALVEPGSHGHVPESSGPFVSQAAMAAGAEPDDPNQRAVRSPSGHLCEAGHYLTEDCYMGQARGCCPCPPGSFLSHPNREESCLLCTRCREDQEMVRDCTPTRDRQCQCKPGEYYCDSERCLEGCHPCTSCPGATLQACTATRDTVCAAQPGPAAGPLADRAWVMFAVTLFILVVVVLIACWWSRGCVSTRRPDRTESLVPESSGPFVSSPETRDADAPVPAMGDRLLPEDSLDVASESLILPGTPESPAGVDGLWPEAEARDEAGPHAGHHGLTLLHFLAALA